MFHLLPTKKAIFLHQKNQVRFVILIVSIFFTHHLVQAEEPIINLTDSPVSVSLTGDNSYQVYVDGQSVSRELSPHPQIKLRSQSFDPAVTDGIFFDMPAGLTQEPEINSGAYLVQFVTPPLEEYREKIKQLGGQVDIFIPEQAHIVRMSDSVRQAVEQLPFVRWVGAYYPIYKLEEELMVDMILQENEISSRRYSIMLLERGDNIQQRVVEHIQSLGGVVEMTNGDGYRLEATLNNAQLQQIVQRADILFIDLWSPPEVDMDIAREIGGANFIGQVAGYSGTGVRGEVIDSGLRTTHTDFQNSLPLIHGINSSSTWHGTHVYGIVFGDGSGDFAAKGMLPDAQGIFSSFYDYSMNHYNHIAELVDPNGPYRVVFQTRSWGNSRKLEYTTISAEMDDILFQHDILVTQAQSNAGTQWSRPQAWAKNIVSVGGIRHLNTLTKTDDVWNYSASIGPAADGRIKPDLSHFYDYTWSTTDDHDTAYEDFGGTSGATPITAGHFGLFFQMWADGVFSGGPGVGGDVFDNRPHMTTAKAMMINTATQYPFSGSTHDLTRVHQGWGMADVGNLYKIARDHSWNLPILIDETAIIQPLETHTYTLDMTDGATRLKATLVYADPMGAVSAAYHRINDLSLRVTSPSNIVYWGNNGLLTDMWSTPGGTSNTIDTVENVFIKDAEVGQWVIEVLADEINQDGHVETNELDADYALVVTKTGYPNIDVWIEDTPYDYVGDLDQGEEPDLNMMGQDMWKSRAIWVRNNPNDPGAHQDPEYGQENEVYVTVQNRGEVPVSNIVVQVYYANTAIEHSWPTHWTQIPDTALIVNLEAGATETITVSWFPPQPTSNNDPFGLIARLEQVQDPMTYPETNDVNYNTRYNNNIAWRNVNITDISPNSPTFDVWIEDTPYDYVGAPDQGNEPDPNMMGQDMWKSRAIWVRNNPNDPGEHQNPEYGQENEVYVTVQNRGEESISNTVVQVYYANIATGQTWSTHWTQIPDTALIASLEPDATETVTISWFPPQPTLNGGHFGLIARLNNAQDPMTFPETNDISYNTRHNNNIAWRNVNIIDVSPNYPTLPVEFIIRNTVTETNQVQLVFQTTNQQGGAIPLPQQIKIGKLKTPWFTETVTGGEIQPDSQNPENLAVVLTTTDAAIDFNLTNGEEHNLSLTFDAANLTEPYLFHIKQYVDGGTSVVSGISYQVQPSSTAHCEHATYSNETRQATLPYLEIPLATDIEGQSITTTGLYSAVLEIPFGFSELQVKELIFIDVINQPDPCHARFIPELGLLKVPFVDVPTMSPYLLDNAVLSGVPVPCKANLQQSILRPDVFSLTQFSCALP